IVEDDRGFPTHLARLLFYAGGSVLAPVFILRFRGASSRSLRSALVELRLRSRASLCPPAAFESNWP
ncbi:MAG TPA: hypothetical protein VGO54_01750, partial [Bradyrhizobium sp.]|nr:hypothetical protein [Bradyrhizobium sp.]